MPQDSADHSDASRLAEEFRVRRRTGLVTLLFTDIVGSARIKQVLGDDKGVALVQQHHAALRDLLASFLETEVIDTAGDSFFILFARPSDAVRFALRWQERLRTLARQSRLAVLDRIGIHIGEVIVEQGEGASKRLFGGQVDTCARIMSLAGPDQILLSRAAFDSARQSLKGTDIEGLAELSWLNHGLYLLKGLEEPIEICEVGEQGRGCLTAPSDVEKAKRQTSLDAEPVLGWRPALEQTVPGTKWRLEKKLGEGGFGEVWLGCHDTLKDRRVFKFCFRADRVRSLKREVTLFRLLKERVGQHPNIVGIQEVFFDQAPFYIVMDYAKGSDLGTWCEAKGGVEKVPLSTRLEIVAQVADALHAAHQAGVIHRDVKPSNILIADAGAQPTQSQVPSSRSSTSAPSATTQPSILVKLTDFGIGQVVSKEYLTDLTRAGFTQTMLSPGSSGPTGTQVYLAPELLTGQAASTGSDIYSTGMVLYQLLIGNLTRPLTTDWAKRVTDPLLRADLEKCLAGDPSERFADAAQLANNLRSLGQRLAESIAREKAESRGRLLRRASVATAMLAALSFLGVYVFRQGRSSGTHNLATQPHQIHSLAVLPLGNLSGDTNQNFFVDGLTMDLMRKLGEVGDLRVIGPNTMMGFKGTTKSFEEIGRELKVDVLLAGAVVLTSNRVDLNVQLIDPARNYPLWKKPLAGERENIVQLQNNLVLDILQEIQVPLHPSLQARLSKSHHIEPEAYNSYLRGRLLGQLDTMGALTNFQRAVALDETFAEGYAALACACVDRLFWAVPAEHASWEKMALDALQKATNLDSDVAEAYAAQGRLLFTPFTNFRHEEAAEALRHALRLNPNSWDALCWLGVVYNHAGFLDESVAELSKLVEVEPALAQTQIPFNVMASPILWSGAPRRALDIYQKHPYSGAFGVFFGTQHAWALFAMKQPDAAHDKLIELGNQYEDKTGELAGMQALLLAAAGDPTNAEAQIQSAKTKDSGFAEFHHTAYFIAAAYAHLNRQTEALRWLRKTADTGFPCYQLFVRDPNLSNLRTNTEFRAFLDEQKGQWLRRSNLWFSATRPQARSEH